MQTLIFPLDRWNKGDAHAWAKRNGFASTKIDTTGGSHRFRQREPGDFVRGSFRTITLSEREDVQAVVGCPKPGRESDRDPAQYVLKRSSKDPGRAGAYSYGPARIWVSGPISDTWYATVRHRNREKDFDARSLNDVLGQATRFVDASRGSRDVARYDLSPAGQRWYRDYQRHGATPSLRTEYERLSRFDKAAIQFLLNENGNGNGERDVLTTRKREKLRATQFALPESRSLPIHDAAHARNAAARLEQMRRRGTVTQNEYRRARAAIRRAERRFGIQPREAH